MIVVVIIFGHKFELHSFQNRHSRSCTKITENLTSHVLASWTVYSSFNTNYAQMLAWTLILIYICIWTPHRYKDLLGEKSTAVFPTQTTDRLASLVDFFRFFPPLRSLFSEQFSTEQLIYRCLWFNHPNDGKRSPQGRYFFHTVGRLLNMPANKNINLYHVTKLSLNPIRWLFIIYLHKAMPVSSIRIILDRFYLIICSFEKLSIWISPPGFVAV